MRTFWTHAKATQSLGTVCGADEIPQSQITAGGHLVTCPDCHSLADIEALPNDATCDEGENITALRDAARGRFRKIDGVVVDATTAVAILTVYDAAKPGARAKLRALPVYRLAQLAWRFVRPQL